MVLPSSHRIPRVLWYSGYPPSEIDFVYKAVTLFRPTFQLCSTIDPLNYAGPKPPRNKFLGFRLFRFRSPLLTKSLIYFLFLRVMRCFSSPGSPLPYYVFIRRYRRITVGGFPHSEICGSRLICRAYLQLPAAYRSLSRPSSALGAKASTLCPY